MLGPTHQSLVDEPQTRPATSVEVSSGSIVFRVCLGSIRELFDAPVFDPFEDQMRVTSGIEDMVNHLGELRWDRKTIFKAIILVPPDAMDNELQKRTHAAVRRYCEKQLTQAVAEEASARYEGLDNIPFAIVFIIFAYLIWGLLHLLPGISKDLADSLTPLVIIPAWVVAWNPIEVLLFDRWKPRRCQEIYRAIGSMEITIESYVNF
jgi:hypothetical protein